MLFVNMKLCKDGNVNIDPEFEGDFSYEIKALMKLTKKNSKK